MRPGSRPAARMLRLCAWAAAALVGLVLFVAVGTPLVVRGPVLSRLVDRLTEDRCGSVTLQGGHFGLGLAPALLFQRPFDVVLEGVRILEPEGDVLFQARVVKARLSVLRNPWRVAAAQVAVADGTWRLANSRLGVPITVALTKIPAAGRSECRAPSTTHPSRRPRQGELLDARHVSLRNVFVVLSFPAWGVTLDSTDARGSLRVRTVGNEAQFLFDVRDVNAKRGGSLRIGRRGDPLTPAVPFDEVAISRVAVTEAVPRDLWLEVQEARTANAVLFGHALFTNAFVPTPRRVPAGMNLDAKWKAIGQALARTPNWAPVGERLARLNAALNVSLRGPFEALTGSAAVDGRGASIKARLLPHRRYRLGVDLHDLATTPLIPPAWRDALGGRLDGQIVVKAQLGRRPRDASISVETLELQLQRTGHAAGPRHVVISRAARPSSSAELRIAIGALTLENQVLRVEPIRVESPAVGLATKLRVARQGSSRAVRFEARTAPASRVTVQGETFRLPQLLRVRLDPGRRLAVEPFSVRHLGGGAVDAGGSVRFGGPVDLRVAVHDYPLARLPGVGANRALRGQLNASFLIAGRTHRPCLSGGLAITGLEWADRALGDGRVAFRCVPGGTRFEGPLMRAVAINGQLRRDTATLHGTVSVLVDGHGLGSWYAGGAGSGTVRAVARVSGTRGAPHVTATVMFDALSVSWPSSPVSPVRVDGPLRVDDRRIVVGPLLARVGAGGWLRIGGEHGPGRMTLAPRPALLPARDVDLTVRGGGLTTTRPIAGLDVRDLALDLRLAQAGEDWRLSGDVDVGHDVLQLPKSAKKEAGASAGPLRSSVADHIWADVHVTGQADAIEVRVPYAPDVTIGVDCTVQGPLSAPRIAGKVKGDGAYSRLLLGVADRFSARAIRKCDLGPRQDQSKVRLSPEAKAP